jgi:arabinofuranosyltransferase
MGASVDTRGLALAPGPDGIQPHRGSVASGGRVQWARVLILGLSLLILLKGWREFWFLTDDAFITFRYISNRHLGLGYVWNPPPFEAVEGYSNFLWMVLLDVVWSVFGIEPPNAANVLSLMCGALIVWRVWRWSKGSVMPVVSALIALGFLLTNRTFLAWTSSGLETALFNLLLLLWFEQAWRCDDARRGTRGFTLLALWAGLAALTRPDGLVAWGATLAMAMLPPTHDARRSNVWTAMTGLALSVVPLHFLWRRYTYAEWLPNTYYAKHVAAWPEAGWRYIASFVLEYGYWAFALLGFVLLLRRDRPRLGVFRLAALASLASHTVYYVVRVGGDHFEFRVLSHWVPLIALAWTYLLLRLRRPWLISVALVVSIAVAMPIQWTHWLVSRKFTTRDQTWNLVAPVAPHVGPLLAPIATRFDMLQAWLIKHHVCMRHQEHKVFGEEQHRLWPTRQWLPYSEGDVPVIEMGTVGFPAWTLPNVAVIDYLGLNDRVVARNPLPAGHFRLMAHDRSAPPGYIGCFRPNVDVDERQIVSVRVREVPLTEEEIRGCEHDFLAIVKNMQVPLPSFAGRPSIAVSLNIEEFDALKKGPYVRVREDFEEANRSLELVGLSFGVGPISDGLPDQSTVIGAQGRYLNSYHRGDASTGMASFLLPRGTRRVALKLAGGANCDKVFVGVISGDRLIAKGCGKDTEELLPLLLSVEPGEALRFVAFDNSTEAWGHIIVDDIVVLDADK